MSGRRNQHSRLVCRMLDGGSPMSWKRPFGHVCQTEDARGPLSLLPFVIERDTIGPHCHVKHEGLTFDVSRTSEHQSVPPSYGTAAGKHVVWEELLTTYVHRTREGPKRELNHKITKATRIPRGAC